MKRKNLWSDEMICVAMSFKNYSSHIKTLLSIPFMMLYGRIQIPAKNSKKNIKINSV